jgi:hypothetical protein
MIEFWSEVHQIEKPGSRLSDTEKDELWDWMKTKNIPLSFAAARQAKGNGAGH